MSDDINQLQLGKDLASATHTAEQALLASTEAAKSSADNSVKLDSLAAQFAQFKRAVDDLKIKVDHINGVDSKLAAQGFFAGTADQNRRIMSFLRWLTKYPKVSVTIITILAGAIVAESGFDLAQAFNNFMGFAK